MNVRRRVLFRLATSGRFERVVRGLPGGERSAYRRARRYVRRSRAEALESVADLRGQGFSVCVDHFGEETASAQEVEAVTAEYLELAAALRGRDRVHLGADLSHLGLDVSPEVCLRQLERIAEHLDDGQLFQLGAEDAARREVTNSVILRAAERDLPVMATVQANLRSAETDVETFVAAGVPIRLVKGAYVEERSIARPWGPPTDEAYVQLAGRIHDLGGTVALATHDAEVRGRADDGSSTLEMLVGIRHEDARQLVDSGRDVRLYLPYGDMWFRYWRRRVAEAQGS